MLYVQTHTFAWGYRVLNGKCVLLWQWEIEVFGNKSLCPLQRVPSSPERIVVSVQVCSRLFLPGDREVTSLTAQQVRRLRDDGFVVVDGFLAATAAAALRSEALQLHAAGDHPSEASHRCCHSSGVQLTFEAQRK